MCFSATTSFLTLGLGTVFNVISFFLLYKWKSPAAGWIWAWQYALLMQIPEGIVWTQYDATANHTSIQVASRSAMTLNVTQPVAVLISVRLSRLYGGFRHSYAVLVMYFVVIFSKTDYIWNKSASIAPSEGCDHLDLRYWDVTTALVYIATSLFIIAEARPLYWAAVNAFIFLMTLLFASIVYSCGTGSVWCWSVFLAGPILLTFELLGKKQKIVTVYQ